MEAAGHVHGRVRVLGRSHCKPLVDEALGRYAHEGLAAVALVGRPLCGLSVCGIPVARG